MHFVKLAQTAAVGLVLVGGLGACSSDDGERRNDVVESPAGTTAENPGAATGSDGLPSQEQLRAYVEATTSYDRSRLEEARDIAKPGSPADEAIDFYLASIDLIETHGTAAPQLEARQTDDGWQVCSSATAQDDCGEITDFRSEGGRLVSYDINGSSIEGTTLVGDGAPAVEGDWGSVTLRVADTGSGTLFVMVDVRAASSGLVVRNGDVGYRTDEDDELDADMTAFSGDIEPGEQATFGISIRQATEIAGEIEVSLRSTDGEFDGEVVVPIAK